MPDAHTTSRPRLRPEVRRELLLDAAVEVLLERGVGGVTMEGVAARAGVNKALPYRHFANADEVLAQLYIRYVRLLGQRVYAAVITGESADDRMRRAISAYFDTVREHGVVLSLLQAPDTRIPDAAEPELDAAGFLETLLVEHFGVPRRATPGVAAVLLAALGGAAAAWLREGLPRRRAELLAFAAAKGLVDASQAG